MGATASGKTALSLLIARQLNAEIISVDSALVYRGLDIGTAKPSLAERHDIVHHLIDIREPWDTYSAASFCSDANELIADIHGRGKRALLVGGTMLYYKALEEGLADLPEANSEVRAALAKQAELHGWQSLHNELADVDPASAARIHPNDPQRVQRALEVYRLRGVSLSELQARTRSRMQARPLKFALAPTQRQWLHQRIEKRFMMMLDNDFMTEMRHLYQHPKINSQLPAMRSVGYRQAWEHLDSQVAVDQQYDLTNAEHWVQKAIAATRQLAKRQLTWLRSMSNVVSVECDVLSVDQQAQRIVKAIETTTQ